MLGNISKTITIKGEPGKDGLTPSISFEYNEVTGELYCITDGTMNDTPLIDKEYIYAHNLATKDDISIPLITSPDADNKMLNLTDLGVGVFVLDGTFWDGYLYTGETSVPNHHDYHMEIVHIRYDASSSIFSVYTHDLKNDKVIVKQIHSNGNYIGETISGGASNIYDAQSTEAMSGIAVAQAIEQAVGDIENTLENIIKKYGLGGENG